MSVLADQKVGIVTVLYNSDEVLPGFFASLAKQQGIRYRLYVIDNGTTDSGIRLSRVLSVEHGIDMVGVFNNANVGVAKGNNQGIEMALEDGCTQVLLANNDTEFGPTTILDLWSALNAEKESAVTPKIMYFDEPELLWYGGGHISNLTGKSPHYGERKRDVGQYDEQKRVGYAPTCFMLFQRSVFEAVGMMDETYFVYSDDVDFVWRMSEKGLHILYVPTSVVLHKVSTSTGGARTPFTVYYTNRNRVYFLRKNFKGLQCVIAIAYMLFTRLPKFMTLPWITAKRGWRGVYDGFRMPIYAIPDPRI